MKSRLTTAKSIIFKNEYADCMRGEIFSPLTTQNYRILQIADSYYLSDFSIDMHRQICDIELTYSIFGTLTTLSDGNPSRLERGDVHISYRGEIHSLYSKSSSRFQTLAVDIPEDSAAYPLLLEIQKKHKSPQNRVRRVKIGALMTEIISEFMSDKPYRDVSVDALITSVLVKLVRGDDAEESYTPERNVMPDILNYIDNNYLDITTLDELAERFSYSYTYLCKLFKSVHGITPHEYMTQKKMDHAKSRICEGASVTEVSEELGYANPFNFSRAYKKHFGVSPNRMGATKDERK